MLHPRSILWANGCLSWPTTPKGVALGNCKSCSVPSMSDDSSSRAFNSACFPKSSLIIHCSFSSCRCHWSSPWATCSALCADTFAYRYSSSCSFFLVSFSASRAAAWAARSARLEIVIELDLVELLTQPKFSNVQFFCCPMWSMVWISLFALSDRSLISGGTSFSVWWRTSEYSLSRQSKLLFSYSILTSIISGRHTESKDSLPCQIAACSAWTRSKTA